MLETNVCDACIQAKLRNKEYCFGKLIEIRKLFSDKIYFKDSIDDCRAVLFGMLLYAPAEIQTLVEGTLAELQLREQAFWAGKATTA